MTTTPLTDRMGPQGEPSDAATPEGFEDEPYIERLARRASIPVAVQRTVDALAFGVIAGILLSYFHPSLLLAKTNTTGGDTGAQIYPPWYLKERLLPRGLLSGWSPGWYSGFPALLFYFPLVAVFQAVLGYLVSYEISFKLGTVLGSFFLPVAVYLLFRLLRFSFPTPIIAAVLSLAFLFMQSFSIYGGNIPSSLAGEFAYSLSLGLTMVFLGLAYRVVTDERPPQVLAAVVLALAVLSHLIPVIVAVLFVPVLAALGVRKHGARRTVARLASVLGIAFALTAFWSVPLLVRLPYATSLRWIPVEGLQPLIPRELRIYLISSLSAAILALFSLDRRFLVLAGPAVIGAALYFLVPGGHVLNARFLPMWYLGVILAAAYFLGSLVASVIGAVAALRHEFFSVRLPSAISVLAAGGVMIALTGSIVMGKQSTFIDDWIRWNYEGYERKAAYPEYKALMDRLDTLPYGRVMWEPSGDYNNLYGTPDVLMAIPYFTKQPTIEGVHYESGPTTLYHFVLASEIADRPFNPFPGLPYQQFNLRRGVQHMQMLGVRYYVAWSEKAKEAATASIRLRHVGDAGPWSIFEIREFGDVVIPEYEPVVLADGGWEETNLQWFVDPEVVDLPLVNDGPPEWARVSGLSGDLPRRPVAGGGEVIRAAMTDDEIAFTTDAIGKPHWVRTSYFPNWKVDGALGPFRASPSVMMVVPTQREVRLHYERTWAEWSGLAITALGLLAVLVLPVRRRMVSPGRA